MTTINNKIHVNDLYKNQIFPISYDTSNSDIISKYTSNLYLGSGSTNLPGITNIFFKPIDLYKEWKALQRSYEIDESEGIVENSLRVMQAPASLGNAVVKLSSYSVFAQSLFESLAGSALAASQLLSKMIAVSGFFLCALELAYESICLFRAASFYSQVDHAEKKELAANQKTHYASFLKTLYQTSFQMQRFEMEQIDRHIKNNFSNLTEEQREKKKESMTEAKLAVKKISLMRRVQPWLAERIEKTLPQILTDLESPLTVQKLSAQEQADALFENIKIQALKSLGVSCVGMLAILVVIAGLITECFPLPILIATTILLVGGGVGFARGLNRGLMEAEGWSFSVEKALPECVRPLIFSQSAE